MLSTYLNQAAVFIPASRNVDGSVKMDNRGQIIYLAPVSISCRKRPKLQEIITPEGQMIKANWIYHAGQKLQIDDLLDGKRVQLVADWIGLAGEVLGYKAVV